ncbi:hypothetical protein BB560_005402 [Smittium megazygosporum]|uniref:Uncharacterized protein n=1 Tax=Smittium megazygosporum TaxID=133381 RepID=A0A2T9Z663_9FUNG|nr:hypothetical protein BB560_005402 [Smittium megazygosporum]
MLSFLSLDNVYNSPNFSAVFLFTILLGLILAFFVINRLFLSSISSNQNENPETDSSELDANYLILHIIRLLLTFPKYLNSRIANLYRILIDIFRRDAIQHSKNICAKQIKQIVSRTATKPFVQDVKSIKSRPISNFPQFEVTLSSESYLMDIMSISNTLENTITGVTESGAILKWELDPSTLKNPNQEKSKNKVDLSKKSTDANPRTQNETRSNLSTYPQDDQKGLNQDTALNELPKDTEPLSPSTSNLKEIVFTENNNLKVLKLQPGYKIIKEPVAEYLMHLNQFSGNNSYIKLDNDPNTHSDSELTVSGLVNSYTFTNPMESLKNELIVFSCTDPYASCCAAITETGKVAIFDLANSAESFMVDNLYNRCSINGYPDNNRVPSNLEIQYPASYLKFAYCTTKNKKYYFKSAEGCCKDEITSVLKPGGKKTSEAGDKSTELVLFIGQTGGTLSVLFLNSKRLIPLFGCNPKHVGKLACINIENETVVLSFSCGAVSLINLNEGFFDQPYEISFVRYLQRQVTSVKVFSGISRKYLIVGYIDGTVLMLQIEPSMFSKQYCFDTRLLNVISIGSELEKLYTKKVETFRFGLPIEMANSYDQETTVLNSGKQNEKYRHTNSVRAYGIAEISRSTEDYIKLVNEMKINSDSSKVIQSNFSRKFSDDFPLFEWPPSRKTEDPSSSSKPIDTKVYSDDIGHLFAHSKKITSIIVRDAITKNSRGIDDLCCCESAQFDEFYVITNSEDGLMRVCYIKLGNFFICRKHKARGDGKFSSGYLVAYLNQNGTSHVDYDQNTNIIVGARLVSPQFDSLSNIALEKRAEQNKDNVSPNCVLSDSRNAKQQSAEKSSLLLTVQDIQHWIIALFVLIWKRLISNIFIKRIFTLLRKFTEKMAQRHSRIRVLSVMFTKYNNSEFDRYNETSYFSQWTSPNVVWFESQRADYENCDQSDLTGVLKNWEMWVLDLEKLSVYKYLELRNFNEKYLEKLTSVSVSSQKSTSLEEDHIPKSTDLSIGSSEDRVFPINLNNETKNLTNSKLFTTFSLYIDRSPPLEPVSPGISNKNTNTPTNRDAFPLNYPTHSNSNPHSVSNLGPEDYLKQWNNLHTSEETPGSVRARAEIGPFDINFMPGNTTLDYALQFATIKCLKVIQYRQDDRTPTVVALACGSNIKLVSI